MKTKNVLSIFLLLATVALNAQLKVLQSGRVNINNQTAIYTNPNNFSDGLDVVYSNSPVPSSYDVIWGYHAKSQPNNPGLITLSSLDGAWFTVKNNGKVGIYNSNPSEALEIGTVGTTYNIKLNGVIIQSSDERLKENIKDIKNPLTQLKQLRGVSYTFKDMSGNQRLKSLKSDVSDDNNENGGIKKPTFIPKSSRDNRNHFGFLAQDVQKLFPDLVYKDSAGMLGVDYVGMIPLLVNALNEQQKTIALQNDKIDEFKSRIATLEKALVPNSQPTETDALSYPVLDQNVPNPFTADTKIGYYLPATTGKATLYVYDMNGVQLKTYPITQRGKGNIIINGSALPAGMYLYALIADGNVVDTKRMILTK